MNPDFLRLKSDRNIRFSEILNLSLAELEKFHREGKLTPEEIQLFQYNDFYFTYAQHNHPELGLVSNKILPLDPNNLSYANWREVVLALEKLLEDKKQVIERLYVAQPDAQFGRFGLPSEIRMMILQNLSSNQIISYCQENVSEILCFDENSLLWRELYRRDISEVPLPIETELMRLNFRHPEIKITKYRSIISFFPKDTNSFETNLVPITYKQIYNLYFTYKFMYFDPGAKREFRYSFIGSLGAEKILEKYPLISDEDIFSLFRDAAHNNKFHIIDNYYESFLNSMLANEFAKIVVFETIFYKAFIKMGKYLMHLNNKFKLSVTDIGMYLFENNKLNNINPEIFEFVIVHMLTKKEMKELFKKLYIKKLYMLTLDQSYYLNKLDKVYLLQEILAKHFNSE